MRHLEQVRAELKAKAAKIRELIAKENLTEQDLAEVEKLNGEVEKLEAQIKTLERAKKAGAADALPANDPAAEPGTETGGQRRAPAQVRAVLKPSEKIGLACVGLVRAKAEGTTVLDILEREGYGEVAAEFGAAQRAVNSTTAASGAILIPEAMQESIIELLYPATTFLQGGPVRIPLVNGQVKIPAGATGSSASYKTENTAADLTEPTFREVEMTAKKLTAIVPMTMEFLRFSIAAARGFVEQDLRQALSVKMDATAYRGDGVGGNPLGITKIAGVTLQTAYNSTTPTLAQVTADLSKVELAMLNANIPMSRVAWVMAPRTFVYIRDMRDGNGNFAFPEMSTANPTLRGIKVLKTTQIPINLGGGTNESELYLIDFIDVLLGDAMGLELKVSEEAAVNNGGTWVSAFQNDLAFIKATMMHDFNVRRTASVQGLNAVKWGG